MDNFADRLARAVAQKRSRCVVGLDTRVEQLPDVSLEAAGAGSREGSGTSKALAEAAFAWNRLVIDAVAETVPAVKIQMAFYERLGAPGWDTVRRTVEHARSAGVLTIVDAKRADIGSTAAAYADALLGEGGLDADCCTVLHYFGSDGLAPFLARVEAGRGLFVVVRSSNPSATETQDFRLSDGRLYYEAVAELVAAWGQPYVGPESGYSAVGAVVGATYPKELRTLRKALPDTLFLLPGFGAQGGTAQDAACGFDADGGGAVVAASRSICGLDEGQRRSSEENLARLVGDRARQMRNEINAVLSPTDS
jgi:orotidine-5'-phosphate decarboxylase